MHEIIVISVGGVSTSSIEREQKNYAIVQVFQHRAPDIPYGLCRFYTETVSRQRKSF